MAYFVDLSPYTDGGQTDRPKEAPNGWPRQKQLRVNLVNVGWLARAYEYARGAVNRELVRALAKLAKRPTNLSRGTHACEFCPSDLVVHGNGEIRVATDSVTYVAPTMVAHYVAAHGYQPPAPFVEAAIEAAKAVGDLDQVEREAIATMTPRQRFELCLGILAELAQKPSADPLLAEANRGLAAVLPFIEKESRGEVSGALRAVVLRGSDSSALQVAALTKEVGDYVFGATDEASVEPTIVAVQRARELDVLVDLKLSD